jgi:hypothetical protein
MFTKLFKKSNDPYELGGRWYKISINADRDDFSIISSDISRYEWGDTVFNIGMLFENNDITFVNCDVLSIVPVLKSVTNGTCSLPANYGGGYDGFNYYNFSLHDFTGGNVTGKIDLYVYAIPYAKVTLADD